MKYSALLACLLVATAGLAQQNPTQKSGSSESTGNMPVRKGHGDALDIPTRNGKGSALAMPVRPTPSPGGLGETMKRMDRQVEKGLSDSSGREKPGNVHPHKKNR